MAFPVTCPACGKAFQLATEIYERKVSGKVVSIKCKQCQAGIRVDATKPGELKVIGATPPGGGDLSVGPKPPEAPKAPAAAAATAPPAGAPAAATPMRMRQPTLIGMTTPNTTAQKQPAFAAKPAAFAPKPAAVAPKPATPLLWAVDSGGTGDDRELSEDEIRREIQAGTLDAQTLVWREGMAEWLELEKVAELKGFLEAPTPEEPKVAPRGPEPKAAPRVEPPVAHASSFQEEQDAEATMIYDRSAPNAAFEPFTVPQELETTARVMLDDTAKLAELEAAPPPPPLPAAGRPAPFAKTAPLADAPPPPLPKPPAPAPLARSAPLADAPPPPVPAPRPAPAARPPLPLQPMPAAAAAPATTAPTPTPSAFRAEAAPAPEPPAPPLPKPPAPAALAAVPWGDPMPSAKPPLPAAAPAAAPFAPDPFAVAATTDLDFPPPRSKKPLVIGIVVAVLAAIGIGIVIASSSAPEAATIAAPPPAPKEAQPPAETKKPEEPEPTSEPTGEAPSGPGESATPSPAPSGNFSDLFSKGVKGSGSGQATKGFDEAAARAALAELLKPAAACKEPGGPTGQANATITFEPSGAVSGVTVGAPFAGSSTGTCIVTTFKRAKVAPFSGLPGTVSQTISLR
ncbi:MAG TPA: GYF domain-containing protein [Polyangiaceae bacterium]